MKTGKTIEITDILVLRNLVKQANNAGHSLQVRKSKKCPYIVCGTMHDRSWPIKMGGTAGWLYDELLKSLTANF